MWVRDSCRTARAIEKSYQQAIVFDILNRPFRNSGFSRFIEFDTRLVAVILISCGPFRVLPLTPDKLLKLFQLLLGLKVVIALGNVDVEADA
jgi:hypothetical protein